MSATRPLRPALRLSSLVGASLLLGACSAGAPRASTVAPAPQSAPAAAPRAAYAAAPAAPRAAPLPTGGAGRRVPGFAQTNASFEALTAQAAATGRPALLYVGAGWCGCCSRFDREVLSQARVAERIRAFPASYYDSETPAGRAVADRFGIHSYPTVLLVGGDGRVVKEVLSLQSADSFLGQLAAY